MSYLAKATVWNGIRLADLERRCAMSFDEYAAEGDLRAGASGQHIFIDRGADILAVAHLDCVEEAAWHFVPWESKRGPTGEVLERKVFCPRLDDRLGAYIITDWFDAHGIKADLLLTEGEESCNSTAGDFTAHKPYRWLIQFDRTGMDVVGYNYMDEAWRGALEGLDVQTARGSVTDLCWLYRLGVKGFNWGVAYYDYHDASAYCKPAETEVMLSKFLRFYETHKDVTLPHAYDPKRDTRYSWSLGDWRASARPWNESDGELWTGEDGTLWLYDDKRQAWVIAARKGVDNTSPAPLASTPAAEAESEKTPDLSEIALARSRGGDMLLLQADGEVALYHNDQGEVWFTTWGWETVCTMLEPDERKRLEAGEPLFLKAGELTAVWYDGAILVFPRSIKLELSGQTVTLRRDNGSHTSVIEAELSDVATCLLPSELEELQQKGFLYVSTPVIPAAWFEPTRRARAKVRA